MPVSRILSIVVLLGLLAVPILAPPSHGADATTRSCLTKAEQREAIAAKKAVPLATAIKSLRDRGRRSEVVRAELCRRGDNLVYELTLLSQNGKVTRATVDAVSGEMLGAR